MTAYAINKVCWLSERNEQFREKLRADPEGGLAGFGLRLDDEERRALLTGDVATLYLKGGHPFLMQHLARHGLFGLTRELYQQRITSLRERETR